MSLVDIETGEVKARTYQLLPPLPEADYAALRDDIAEHGIRVPVDTDEDGNILDGHHRARIADELGIVCPARVIEGLDEAGKRGHALAVNVHRRSLTRDEKRELIRASLKADPGLSDRQHAERVGVDHKTVGTQRDELQGRGEIPHVEQRSDSMGRKQPARPLRPEPTTDEVEPTAPSPTVEDWLASDPKGQDAKYLTKFYDAIARNDWLRFDAERIGQIGTDADVRTVELHLQNTERFLDEMKRARSGLRVVNGGRA